MMKTRLLGILTLLALCLGTCSLVLAGLGHGVYSVLLGAPTLLLGVAVYNAVRSRPDSTQILRRAWQITKPFVAGCGVGLVLDALGIVPWLPFAGAAAGALVMFAGLTLELLPQHRFDALIAAMRRIGGPR